MLSCGEVVMGMAQGMGIAVGIVMPTVTVTVASLIQVAYLATSVYVEWS